MLYVTQHCVHIAYACRWWDVNAWRGWWELVQRGREALFDCGDPLPWLAMVYEQVPCLLWRLLINGRRWATVDLCIGKVVEVQGD